MHDFETAFSEFCAMADELVKTHDKESWAASGKTRPDNFPVPEITYMPGKRYVRVVKQERIPVTGKCTANGSVFCFVDATNGDILKAAGWKAPAKGKRGSIFDIDHGRSAIDAHGAVYLR